MLKVVSPFDSPITELELLKRFIKLENEIEELKMEIKKLKRLMKIT